MSEIADAVAAGIEGREAILREEQAICGLDALDEVDLHPILADGLTAAGFGVAREVRYPEARRGKRRETEGERCDLVLTPEGRELCPTERRATLFDPGDSVDPEQAFWLEVKCVAQYTPEGANRQWASQLLSTVSADVAKLARADGIVHAGLLIVLFVRDPEVVTHDLGVWEDRCMARGFPISPPSRRDVAIVDRLDNRLGVVALYPVGRA